MTEKLYPGYYYHIYNRGNNRENIFYLEKNYQYFLENFYKYLSGYLDIYTYCLLSNHFHFLIKIKENDSITSSDGIDKIISEQFRRFFLGYSQAINIQQNRTGSLFQKNFKRKRINKNDYLYRIIYYIHLNPVLHKICTSFEDYPFSSYGIILSNKPTKIKRNKVLALFRNKKEFFKFHQMRLTEKEEFKNFEFNRD